MCVILKDKVNIDSLTKIKNRWKHGENKTDLLHKVMHFLSHTREYAKFTVVAKVGLNG